MVSLTEKSLCYYQHALTNCMNNYNQNDNKRDIARPTLPAKARQPINRCNLPPQILGGLNFQQYPAELRIDNVHSLHKQLFDLLDKINNKQKRAEQFMDYMVVQFRLQKLEEAGLVGNEKRGKADYLRLLRGWLFNTEGREAAVLKYWVESRFGLLARYHKGKISDHDSDAYQAYLAAYTEGLYGTNALEAQLDLLYSYCQYELAQLYPAEQSLRLYRGVNRMDEFEILEQDGKQEMTILLNNLNSFTLNRERAEEFGDTILEASVPWQKVMFYSRLLAEHHIGEEEYLVIGGVYKVSTQYW